MEKSLSILSKLFLDLHNTRSVIAKTDVLMKFFISLEIDGTNESWRDDLRCEVATLFKLFADPCYVTNVSKITFSKAQALACAENFDVARVTLLSTYAKLCDGSLRGSFAEYAIASLIALNGKDSEETLRTLICKQPIGVDLALINKAHKTLYGDNFVEYFNVQLANKYDGSKIYPVDYWYATYKLDGIRGYYVKGTNKFMSRQNKEISGFEHIIEELELIAEKFNIKLFDGELYTHGVDFDKIQSIVTKDAINKQEVLFKCFAVVGFNTLSTEQMYSIMEKCGKESIKFVEFLKATKITNSYDSILDYTTQAVLQGYEGAMLRHPMCSYDNKRSNNLLKCKLFKEDDFVVKSIYEGDNKYANMLGAIGVVSKNGKVAAKVGSGFTDEQRVYYWNNINEILGKTVEVKFQCITTDGSLRFPTFRKVKLI